MAITRASNKRPGGRSRRPPSKPQLPKAKEPKLLDVTGMRRDLDYERLSERVDLIEADVRDHGEGIRLLKADHELFGGLDKRVKALEDKPDPVVVDKDGEVVPVPLGTIAAAFLVHDLAVGALLVAAYWLARGAGWL